MDKKTLIEKRYYELLYRILPKQGKSFIKYNKKAKFDVDTDLKKELKKIFNCNDDDLEENYQILIKEGNTEKTLKEVFGLK